MSSIIVGRILAECSKQQIMSAECEETTPKITDFNYHFPVVAISYVIQEILSIFETLESLINNNGLKKPNAGEKAQILCGKFEKLQQVETSSKRRFIVLSCMIDDESETPPSLVYSYKGSAFKYPSPNKNNLETFVYRESYDIKANYEKILEDVKALDREVKEYLNI